MGFRRPKDRRSVPAVRDVVSVRALLLSLFVAGCSTTSVLDLFNAGALDSPMDPAISAAEMSREVAYRIVREQTMGAYFGQGLQGPVPEFFRQTCAELDALTECVECRAKRRAALRRAGAAPDTPLALSPAPEAGPDPQTPNRTPSASPTASPSASAAEPAAVPLVAGCGEILPPGPDPESRPCSKLGKQLEGVVARARPPHVSDAICTGTYAGSDTTTARLEYSLDEATFLSGLEVAVEELTRVVDEGLVTPGTLKPGACLALTENAAYLENRKWKRERSHPVRSLVVKGGGSTGVYSAGAVWRLLHVVHQCKLDTAPGGCAERSGPDVGFEVLSGTSAGALVSAVTDLFHQQSCLVEKKPYRGSMTTEPVVEVTRDPARCRQEALDMLATFFRCVSQRDLYCAVDGQLPDLAEDQLGLMRFDGIRLLMRRFIKDDALRNRSELVANSVDFRYGELFAQSDQDPSQTLLPTDVADAVEASFVLPVIAEPVLSLRHHGVPMEGRFIDGGIRSELPLMSAVQRGAERVLAISSSPSRILPAPMQQSALAIAARYIDVSLSAVTEAELARAELALFVSERRRADACGRILSRDGSCTGTCEAAQACNGVFALACDDKVDGAPASQVSLRTVFRSAFEVDPSAGYSFDPAHLRRLFDAGSEATRQRCVELAQYLGVVVDTEEHEQQLRLWCSELPVERTSYCSADDLEIRICPEAKK